MAYGRVFASLLRSSSARRSPSAARRIPLSAADAPAPDASAARKIVSSPPAKTLPQGSCGHARYFSHHTFPGTSSLIGSNLLREVVSVCPKSSYKLLSRCFSSENDFVDAVVPFMGESISDGTLATFLKKPGDRVGVDEPIAQIETDKVTIDVVSPEAGVIEKFTAKEGDTVTPGTKVAVVSKSAASATQAEASADKTVKGIPQQAPIKVEPEKPKQEAPREKPKESSPAPPRLAPSEPQLPPKERERRVPMPRLGKLVATRLKDSKHLCYADDI